MSVFELSILAAIFIGFFWLILDVAKYARMKKEE